MCLQWSGPDQYIYSPITKYVSRGRFHLLSDCFDFSNSFHNMNNDSLFKNKPLPDDLYEKFQLLYAPESAVVIDESHNLFNIESFSIITDLENLIKMEASRTHSAVLIYILCTFRLMFGFVSIFFFRLILAFKGH